MLVKNWNKALLILLLIAVIALIRFLPVIEDNVHFSFDQGLDILMVRELVVDHKINLISRYSGLQGVLMGPLWTWIMAIPFALSGGNPSANVIFFIALSLAGSLMTYFLFKKIIGVGPAFFIFLLTLFSPFFAENTRIILSPHFLVYTFFLYVYCVYKIFIDKKSTYLIPLSLFLGLCFQFEIAFALFTFPPLLLMTLFFKGWRVFRFRDLSIGIVLFSITFIPQIIFDLRHNHLISNSLIQFVTGNNNSLYSNPVSFSIRFWERWKTLSQDFLEMAFFVSPSFLKVVYIFSTVIGLAIVFKKKIYANLKSLIEISLIIIVGFYGGFIFYPGPVWAWYRSGLPIVFIIFPGVALYVLYKTNTMAKVMTITLFLGIIYQLMIANSVYFFSKQKEFGGATLKTQKRVLDYIYSSAEGKNFSYYVYTPPVYDYIWQYDFWWYGFKKYGRIPSNWQNSIPLLNMGDAVAKPTSNQGLIYLIIEPDVERPWAPKGWLESYIKVGKITEIKKIGDIIIEKRIAIE